MLGRQSQRCPRDCSGVLVVASLEETQGLLSRFDCVYSGYITQGGTGGALVGCYELRCQMLLFPYTLSTRSSKYHRGGTGGTLSNRARHSTNDSGQWLETQSVLEVASFLHAALSLPATGSPPCSHRPLILQLLDTPQKGPHSSWPHIFEPFWRGDAHGHQQIPPLPRLEHVV